MLLKEVSLKMQATTTSKKIIGTAAGTMLVLGSFGTAIAAPAQQALASEDGATSTAQEVAEGAANDTLVQKSTVQGLFTASQAQTATVDVMKNLFRNASAMLCNAGLHEEAAPAADVPADAMEWEFSVSGQVRNPYTAVIGDLVDDENGVQQKVMGCTCAGNPTDGRTIANAEVTGLKLATLLQAASPTADANAVVLTSADGYSQTVPLYYILSHSCVLAYEVAGEPVSESMGGTVQLWLHGASANYYVSNVTSIELVSLPETPDDPSESDAFQNSPNVTVLEAV